MQGAYPPRKHFHSLLGKKTLQAWGKNPHHLPPEGAE